MKSEKNHLWGGRFNEPTDEFVKIFGASIAFDKILALYDIQGSIAHATMLSEIDVLSSSDLNEILKGLTKIKDEIVNDQFNWSIDLEDVHMNIESRLIEICGDRVKKFIQVDLEMIRLRLTLGSILGIKSFSLIMN